MVDDSRWTQQVTAGNEDTAISLGIIDRRSKGVSVMLEWCVSHENIDGSANPASC
jgi:hypothetical protein